MPTKFNHCPVQPKHSDCERAFLILSKARESATSLLTFFQSECAKKGAGKKPSERHQDLLRAMLIFASAGLDSMLKRLITDALRLVIDRDEGAATNFTTSIKAELDKQGKGGDHKFLAGLICDREPRERAIDWVVSDLISGSLQSADALDRVARAFNIPSKDLGIVLNDKTSKQKPVFKARNQIAHEMDIDLAQPQGRTRRIRDEKTMVEFANEVFRLSAAFLKIVDAKLNTAPSNTASPDVAAKGKRSALPIDSSRPGRARSTE